MATDNKPSWAAFLRSRTGLALIGFLGIAAFFMMTEHRAHLLGVLPYVLLLLCPLMYFLGHGGGKGHDAGNGGHAQHPKGGSP